MDLLKDQTAIVFGATGSIGSQIAQSLAQKGAKVIVHYHQNEKAAEQLVQDINATGGNAYSIQADVRELESVTSLVNETLEKFGAFQIVVNTVHRSGSHNNVIDMQWSDWDAHIEALKSHFNICKSILPTMQQQKYGRIVYLSGGLSVRHIKGCSAYSAIKAGLNNFCKSLALEIGEYNITVNIVAPGKVVSINKNEPADIDELCGHGAEQTPLKRFASTEDVNQAVNYFVSPSAGCITGQTLFVTGGEIMP